MGAKKTIRIICNALFVGVMAFIVIAVFVPPKSINWVKALGSYGVLAKVLIALAAVILTILRVALYKKTKSIRLGKKHRRIAEIAGAAAILLVCCFVAYKLTPEPYNTFDSAQIYGFVQKASTGAPIENETYFNRYPHNLGIVMFYLSFVRMGVLIGFPNPQILMLAVTVLSVAMTIMITAYLASKIVGRHSRFRIWVMALIAPLALYSAEMYTDSISGFFVALELLVMFKIYESKQENRSNRLLLYVILALVAGIGAIIKITSIIPIIAMGIVCLTIKLRSKIDIRRAGRITCGALVCLACFCGIFFGYKSIERQILPGSREGSLPYSHWVMMGMNGDGIFSSEELESSLAHAPETGKYNVETIKRRFLEMGPIGYISLLLRKVSVTWGDGTYEISRVVGTQPRKPDSMAIQVVGVNGKYFKYYRLITTIYQLSWLLSFLTMAILTRKKNNSKILVLKLSLIGIFSFLLIWETNSRYLVNFLPVLLLLQEYSMMILWQKARSYRENAKA